MIKEIKYNGYTATPSDYECHDGDLDIALNFTTDDGSLHPSLPPLQIAKVPDGQHILGIHTLHSEKKNFISWRHSADQLRGGKRNVEKWEGWRWRVKWGWVSGLGDG